MVSSSRANGAGSAIPMQPVSPGMMQQAHSAEEDSIELFALIRRRKWIMIMTTLFGIALAMAYQFTATPIYEAELKLMPMRKDSSMPSSGVEEKAEVDGSSLKEDVLANHMEMFGSRSNIAAAIEKYELTKVKSISEEMRDGVDPVDYIEEQLSLETGGEGSARDATVLVARFGDPSATDCATVLQALLLCYQDRLKQNFSESTTEAIALVTKNKNELENELTAISEEYNKLRLDSELIWDGDKAVNIHRERLQKMESDLRDVQRKRSETQARLEVIQEYLAKNNVEEISDLDRLALLSESETQRLKLMFDVSKGDINSEEFQADQPIRTATAKAQYEELLSLKLKEKSLEADFGPDHPLVQITRDKIAVMNEFLRANAAKEVKGEEKQRMRPAEMLAAFEQALRHDLAELKKLESTLLSETKAVATAARRLADDESRVQELTEVLEVKRDAYKNTVTSLDELKRAQEFGGYRADVLAAPEKQRDPAWPKLPIVGALGAVSGVVLGFLLGLVSDLTDSTFRNPDDVQKLLNLPLLAHVPVLAQESDPRLATVGPEICTAHRPRSREAEVFRALRTSLYFQASTSKLEVIQVTSPSAGDGKSTVAANLAVAIAQSGRKVLLVDCDMRRPRAAGIFGVKYEDGGLSTVLAGRDKVLEVLTETEIENLQVLSSGPIPPNPAELLTTSAFGECVAELRATFDFVILDSPPLLAVSDPGIIASHADGVVLTLRILKNGRGASIRAREILEELRASTLGLVVNCSSTLAKHYGYSDYRYADSYSYEYRDKAYYVDANSESDKSKLGYSRAKA